MKAFTLPSLSHNLKLNLQSVNTPPATFPLWILLGSFVLFSNQMSAAIDALAMNRVEILATDVIDSDAQEDGDPDDPNRPYKRDKIQVELSFNAKGPSKFGTEEVQITLQILDNNDNIVPLTDKARTIVIRRLASYNNQLFGVTNTFQFEIPFFDGYVFSQYKRYRVIATVENHDSSASSSLAGSPTQLFHYPGPLEDPDYNTILTPGSVIWVNPLKLDFDETKQAFSFEYRGQIRRYDPNGDPLELANVEYELYRYVDGTNDVLVSTTEPIHPIDRSIPAYTTSLNGIKIPILETIEETIEFQLSSSTMYQCSDYYIVARLLCDDGPGDPKDSLDKTSAREKLAHMNGTLMFGDFETSIVSWISLNPLGDFGNTGRAEFVGAGEAVGQSAHTFNIDDPYNPTVPIDITISSNGTAYYSIFNDDSRTIALDGPARGSINDIHFDRGPVSLSKNGAAIEQLAVYLPAGMGCADYNYATLDPLPTLLDHTLEFDVATGISLSQNLYPDEDMVYWADPADHTKAVAVAEESRPLMYVTDYLVWEIAEGRILAHDEYVSDNFQIHFDREAFDSELFLLTQVPVGTNTDPSFNDPDEVEKPSNDNFYRYIKSLTDEDGLIYFKPDTNDGAAVTAGFIINTSWLQYATGKVFTVDGYKTHFPLATHLSWYKEGELHIVDDVIIGGVVEDAADISVPYSDLCSSGECPADFDPATGPSLRMTPTDHRLWFTPDGGIYADGDIHNGFNEVKWGYHIRKGTDRWAQSTDPIDYGYFVMSGTHVIGQQYPRRIRQDHGASIAMLSGYNTTGEDGVMERPPNRNPLYAEGHGYYAGMNFWGREQNGGAGIECHSYLTGTEVNFIPSDRIKYYCRYGGVTGIHEALEPPNPLIISDYKFELTGYKFSFLDSQNHQSLTEGSLGIPGYIGIRLDFEEMMVSCVGDLEEAKLVDEGDGLKDLNYWNGQIQPLSMQFAKGGGCPADPAGNDCNLLLSVGVKAWAAHLPTPMTGYLGMTPQGNFHTPQDEVNLGTCATGINSRLSLPATFKFSGPGNETYTVVPVTQAYYNNPDISGHADVGNISFAGTMGVPLFDDLEVHVCTSARIKADTEKDAIVYIQGGWKGAGDSTFFNSVLFDADHATRPNGVSQEDYHSTINKQYLTHAKHNWLDIVQFDYPIIWDEVTRSFKSIEPVSNDLLVLNVDHEIKYLSARSAELKFGAVFQGVPEVNLAQFTLDRIDGPLESFQEVLEDGTEAIAAEMIHGIDSAADLVSDRLEDLVEEMFVELIDPLIDGPSGFYNSLLDEYNAAPDQWSFRYPALLQGHLRTNGSSVQNQLKQLTQNVTHGLGLLEQIDNKLARAQNAIRAVAGQVMFDAEENGNVIPDADDFTDPKWAKSGLIYKENPEDDYAFLQHFIYLMLQQLSQDLADNLGEALGGAFNELNAEINSMLGEHKATIDEVVVVLNRLDETIGTIRDKLEGTEQLAVQLEAIVAASNSEIESLIDDAVDELDTYFVTMGTDTPEFGSMNAEVVKQRIRNAVKDRFIATMLIDDVKTVLKQQVFDLQALMQASIDNVFAQVNDILMDLVESAVAELDDEINGFLDDLANVVGGGQIQGYAHIHDDSLRKLRLDLNLELKMPDDFTFRGYLEINQMNSLGDTGCDFGGDDATEVKIGALDVGVGWISPDLKMNIEGKFSFNTDPHFQLRGMGAGLTMVGGELSFEGFAITEFGAALAFGMDENYVAAKCGMRFSSYEVNGGFFFGRTCFIDPIKMIDPDVADVIGTPPFTGGYVFGGCHIPVSEAVLGIPASCFFTIGAGVETGVFYFVEGPTYGGKIGGSVSGEAICLVSIKGEMMMIGVKKGDNFTMQGKGKVKGKVGACPFCIKFSKGFKATYQSKDDSWDLDM